MRCHACDQPATRQWQRAATDTETAAHLDGLRAGFARVNDQRRLSLRIQIAELKAARENPPKHLDEPDRRAFLARADAQITATQGEHDAVADTLHLDHHLPVTVAVFGCDEHALDEERAALLHDAHCDPADCRCGGELA